MKCSGSHSTLFTGIKFAVGASDIRILAGLEAAQSCAWYHVCAPPLSQQWCHVYDLNKHSAFKVKYYISLIWVNIL